MAPHLSYLFPKFLHQKLTDLLQLQINPDKSFISYSSNEKDSFINSKETKTTLVSSIVFNSLSNSNIFTQSLENQKRSCLFFLLNHQSSDGAFNYHYLNGKYVNDIDDTALAKISFHQFDKKLFKINDLKKFVYCLIKCEVAEGGPYTTWLNSNYPIEVDTAVNINIARTLQIHEIVLPSLTNLVSQTIEKNNYKSMYYTSPLFTIYFLSFIKNLTDEQKQKIIKYILSLSKINKKNSQKNKMWDTLIESVLAANALINLSAPYELIMGTIEDLGKIVEEKEIPHEAICLDPAVDGKQMYCGSKAVTIALLLEINKFRHQYLLKKFERFAVEKELSIEGLTKCLITDFTEIIFGFADSLCQGCPLSAEELMKMTCAHLCGILAYDILDDMYDEGKNLNNIPLSINLLQNMCSIYDEMKFDRKIVDNFVFETNRGMSEEKSENKIDDLYPGRKSIGFALPCFLIISKMGITDKHSNWKNLHKFFLHFLTARALHDDMLDLSKDRKENHPNAVADLIKQNPKKDLNKLVQSKIKYHIVSAKKYLNNISILNPDNYLHHLLNKLF